MCTEVNPQIVQHGILHEGTVIENIYDVQHSSVQSEEMHSFFIDGEDNNGNREGGDASQPGTQNSLDNQACNSLNEQEWTQVIHDKNKKAKETQKDIANRKELEGRLPPNCHCF